jgi:hypothetical protein
MWSFSSTQKWERNEKARIKKIQVIHVIHYMTHTVHYVTPTSPHSPLYPDRLFIEGTLYLGGVAEYMQKLGPLCPGLLEAMMQKYTQHIHLQKIFQDPHPVRLVHGPGPAWLDVRCLNEDVYPELQRQFLKINDIEVYEQLIGSGQRIVEQMDYIRRAQPACGLDKALELSKLWIEKKRDSKTPMRYHIELEEELALYYIKE